MLFLSTLAMGLMISSTPPHGGVSPVGTAPVELNASVEKLSSDALDGDQIAAAKLSDYYTYDKIDAEFANKWTLIAAENGYARSQFAEYNILILKSDLSSQRRPLFWLKKSAQQGFDSAVLEMKTCFPVGDIEHHVKGCVGDEIR